MNLQLLPQRLRPLVQRCQRGVEHLARFQTGQGRRVDPNPFGHLGQRQSLAFSNGLEPGHQAQDGREALQVAGWRTIGVGRPDTPGGRRSARALS